jgi:hypothetical protein
MLLEQNGQLVEKGAVSLNPLDAVGSTDLIG